MLAPRVVPDSRLTTARRRFDALGAIVGTGGLVLLVDAIAQVAASHTAVLARAGSAVPVALTGGFRSGFWVLAVIALTAVPAILALVRRNELSGAEAKTAIHGAEPAPASAS